MRNRAALLVLVLVLCHGITTAMGLYRDERVEREEEWAGEEGRREKEETIGGENWFLLQDSKHVVKTDAGEMKVLRSLGGRIVDRHLHIGFITMEPKSLFIPQYLDSSLIIFIRTGEAKIGLIYRDELAERRLKIGDIYRIPAGSTFYLVNTGERQRLHAICSIDTSESLGLGTFQSFFIGGGTNPPSILSGFAPETLASAFNVTTDEVEEITTRQRKGPIVYVDSHSSRPSVWAKFLQLKEQDRLQRLKRAVQFQQEPFDEDEQTTWSFREFLTGVFGQENKKIDKGAGKSPYSYNIYARKPNFRNNYGWSVALDESAYDPLKHSGIGVYLVNLTAGSMMAPHVNPTATEYGIVLRGRGSIQIVYPNGTQALKAKVAEGDVFWVPRYFPFCQIASQTGRFEFFGFTTAAGKNRPQFLAGANSILRTLRGPELAAAFGTSDERLRHLVEAQREAVILPSASTAPLDQKERKRDRPEKPPKVIKNFGNEMIMAYD